MGITLHGAGRRSGRQASGVAAATALPALATPQETLAAVERELRGHAECRDALRSLVVEPFTVIVARIADVDAADAVLPPVDLAAAAASDLALDEARVQVGRLLLEPATAEAGRLLADAVLRRSQNTRTLLRRLVRMTRPRIVALEDTVARASDYGQYAEQDRAHLLATAALVGDAVTVLATPLVDAFGVVPAEGAAVLAEVSRRVDTLVVAAPRPDLTVPRQR